MDKKTAQGNQEEEDVFKGAQGEEMENSTDAMKKKIMERAGLSPQQVEMVIEVEAERMWAIPKTAARDVPAKINNRRKYRKQENKTFLSLSHI